MGSCMMEQLVCAAVCECCAWVQQRLQHSTSLRHVLPIGDGERAAAAAVQVAHGPLGQGAGGVAVCHVCCSWCAMFCSSWCAQHLVCPALGVRCPCHGPQVTQQVVPSCIRCFKVIVSEVFISWQAQIRAYMAFGAAWRSLAEASWHCSYVRMRKNVMQPSSPAEVGNCGN